MPRDGREPAQALCQPGFGHGLPHADQHGLEIGARWCEPSRLIRASEIVQIAVHDAAADRSAFRLAEAFLLQARIEFAVVPRIEAVFAR